MQIYKCERLADDCSSCWNLIEENSSFECQWCPSNEIKGLGSERIGSIENKGIIGENDISGKEDFKLKDKRSWVREGVSSKRKGKTRVINGDKERKSNSGNGFKSPRVGMCVHSSVCSVTSQNVCPPPEILDVSLFVLLTLLTNSD